MLSQASTMSIECANPISAIVSQVGVVGCRKHTITHVDTRWNHYYMDTLLRTVSEMTLAKKTSPRLALAKKTL